MSARGLVDSHAHLEMKPFHRDLAQVLARARTAGVLHVLTVGTTLPEIRRALLLAGREDMVTAAAGIHPHEARLLDRAALTELASLACGGRIAALGETGLDFHYDHSPRPVQEDAFRRQIALAQKAGLPLIIHLREAYERGLMILKEEGLPGRGGVVHCFSGEYADARVVLGLGLLISLTGTITFPSERSRAWNQEVVARLPLDRLMVETDCPYLAPHPHRGKRNEPAFVTLVAEKLAEVKGVSPEDVARVTTRNAAALFHLPLPAGGPTVAYTIRDSVYLNVTADCPNACLFCRRASDPVVKGHDLTLARDPTAGEMLQALEEEHWRGRGEVVFCGYGEPTCRLEEVLEVAGRLKRMGAKRVRLNTNGLGNLLAGRDIVPDLARVVDAVSVSLNAPDEATYLAVCRPSRGPVSFASLLAFARSCVARGLEVTLTALPWPGVDLPRCKAMAEEMGAGFRVRPLDEVG